MCRLRPTIFFPPVVAALAARLGRLHRLAVDQPGGGLLRPPLPHALPPAQGVVQAHQRPVPGPLVEVVAHRVVVRELVRQEAPLAAGAQLVQHAVDHPPQVDHGRVARAGLPLHERPRQFPLRVRQVAIIPPDNLFLLRLLHRTTYSLGFGPKCRPSGILAKINSQTPSKWSHRHLRQRDGPPRALC